MRDGDFTTARKAGGPVFSQPIPGVNTSYLLSQPFMRLTANWSPLALGTAHPDYATFKLVEETDRVPMGDGIERWTRVYAAKPATHYDWETYAYNFIGFWGVFGINTTGPDGRERRSAIVTSRITYDYYSVLSSGGDYTSEASIPILKAQKYLINATQITVDYLSDAPPFDTASDPTRTEYEAMIADAVANGWSATTGLIVAEDSTISRWHGHIWQRRTRYILAE